MHLEQRSATTDEITMNRPHFRVKVDLSMFFHDARRFCWIFIDATKIQQIIHLMHHVSKLFTIEEPFHFLLNDTEYLPPIEDVRILKENETILVVPGSGINNSSNDTIETHNSVSISKQVESNDTLNNVRPMSQSNTTRDMTFYSVINNTVDHSGESDTSKITDTNITEDMVDSFVSVGKRKRVRKRRPKSKNQFQLISPIDLIPDKNQSKEQTLKKPKIIDSYIIPSGKHIRFDKTEDENNIAKEIVQEVSKTESYLNKPSSSKDFSTLLALGQSSTPITFASKKLKSEIKTDREIKTDCLNDEVRMNLKKIIEASIEKNVCNKESKEIESYKKLYTDIEKIPIMITKPQINDIIAFKTLKLGPDYSPQLSNVILSKVIGIEAKTGNYTLQILLGREEVQVPFGKFVVSEDESESQSNEDIFVLNYSQIREPRLIS